jgi:hypothetical protein
LIVGKMSLVLAWNMVHTLPLVDATSTLHWDAPFEFTTAAGGALIFVYKLFFLIPLSHLVGQAGKRIFGQG